MAIIPDVDEDESEAIKLWRRTLEALLAKGESPANAIDGANLVLRAYERQRRREEESLVSEMKASGIRRKKTRSTPDS